MNNPSLVFLEKGSLNEAKELGLASFVVRFQLQVLATLVFPKTDSLASILLRQGDYTQSKNLNPWWTRDEGLQ